MVSPQHDEVQAILHFCQEHQLKIAAAESLTGGLLADAFVQVPGASQVFLGSAVTYDIRAKASILGVDAALLQERGAVDAEVARQMARNVAALYDQPMYQHRVIGLATTGVAGPGADDRGNPAGLVYVACALPSGSERLVQAWQLHLHGSREEVRRAAVAQVVSHLAALLQHAM